MKTYRDVVVEKQAQVAKPSANSIHRSSLLFPVSPLPGARPTVALSNHFKIKRSIPSVGMRIWGLDANGKRAFSDLITLDEPRVYRYDLAEHCPDIAGLSSCQVEFFSAANLGMPYPAAMVNHVGAGFHNAVHSFARVLNDVFESDEINAIKVAEASIDVCVDERFDTFLCFLTGARELSDNVLYLSLRLPGGETLEGKADVARTRFASTTIFLSGVFPDRTIPFGSVLRARTPTQPDLFGRLMGGVVCRADGAFSANHTYYDHGVVPEYLDATHAYAYYPLFPGRRTRLAFYPIQSPSVLSLQAEYFDASGRSLGKGEPVVLRSPNGDTGIVEVSSGAPAGATVYRIDATAIEGSKLPSRVSHQVVMGGEALTGSINESLTFPHEQGPPPPHGKGYLSWIQGVAGPETTTDIGLSLVRDTEIPAQVELAVYDEQGLVGERTVDLAPRSGTVFNARALLGGDFAKDRYFFLYARCSTSRTKMFSLVSSTKSGHCSAEHSF